MKKKIKDLTLEEIKKICEQYDYSFCEECELYSKETECCLVEPPLLEKDLEREVEIDEINFN